MFRNAWISSLGAFAVFSMASAGAYGQSYFRMGVNTGHPNPMAVPNFANNNAFGCFKVSGNSILTQPSDTSTTDPNGCPYLEGAFQYWQVNPPTKSTGSYYDIGFWVGGDAEDDQSVCFTAWSYNNTGVTHEGTQSQCKFGQAYNFELPDLEVPPYGATTVLAAFEVLEEFVTPDGTRWSEIAWPYN